MSTAWKGGSTRRWRTLRAAVLADNLVRNGGRCTIQGPPCTGRATHAHHTLGKRVTGDDARYLVAACAACNLWVGDPASRGDPPSRAPTRW